MQEQNDIKNFINNLNGEFQEILGGGFYNLITGEFFTKTEVQKYIQRRVEEYTITTVATINRTLRESNEIETEQRLINKRSKNKKSKLKTKDRYEGGDFNIIYRDRIEEVNGMKLNNNEKLVFYVLRDFAQYPTNCIVIKDSIPTMKELEPIIGLNEKTIRNSLKSLQEKNLVKLKQYGHRKSIYINPEYYATGKDLDIEILHMFNLIDCDDNKIDEYIENSGCNE